MTDTQREAFEAWQKDPRFYQWNTTDEHAVLNFEAGYQAAQAADAGREAVAYMYPSDIDRFKRSETTAECFSVSVTNIDTLERTVPVYMSSVAINAELVEALEGMIQRIEFYSRLKDSERPNIEQWEYTEGSSDMAKARAALFRAKEQKS
jgi:hypothetical protein